MCTNIRAEPCEHRIESGVARATKAQRVMMRVFKLWSVTQILTILFPITTTKVEVVVIYVIVILSVNSKHNLWTEFYF